MTFDERVDEQPGTKAQKQNSLSSLPPSTSYVGPHLGRWPEVELGGTVTRPASCWVSWRKHGNDLRALVPFLNSAMLGTVSLGHVTSWPISNSMRVQRARWSPTAQCHAVRPLRHTSSTPHVTMATNVVMIDVGEVGEVWGWGTRHYSAAKLDSHPCLPAFA